MPDQAQPRSLSRILRANESCRPLLAMYQEAERIGPTSWDHVEAGFLSAMQEFDKLVALGLADQGARQNGKGDFLNDLLALILENCAGVSLWSRGGVPGLIFPTHNLDVTYPNSGDIEFMVEVKAMGTPRHPGSPGQRPIGRPGSADLDKRIKEGAFKTIDLKAEYARIRATRGVGPTVGPGGNLTTWLRSVKPTSYLFISARVTDASDHRQILAKSRRAAQVFDVVGVFLYSPVDPGHPTDYEVVEVDDDLAMDRVLFKTCQDLANLRP